MEKYDMSIGAILARVETRDYHCVVCGRTGHKWDFSEFYRGDYGICTLCTYLDYLLIKDKSIRALILEYYSSFKCKFREDKCDVKHCFFCENFWHCFKQDKGITISLNGH